jgi:hypothetical protein
MTTHHVPASSRLRVLRTAGALAMRSQTPVAVGVRVETPPPLRDRDRRPGALVGGVGGRRDLMDGQRVDDPVLAGGTHVVPCPGQRRGDPHQPADRIGNDLHVQPVGLVFAAVVGPVSA